MTPLLWAIQNIKEDERIFHMVLEKTTDVNYQDSKGQTSLHYLVRKHPSNSNQMVRELYDKDMDESIKDNDGHTALDIAVELKFVAMAELEYLSCSTLSLERSLDAVYYKCTGGRRTDGGHADGDGALTQGSFGAITEVGPAAALYNEHLVRASEEADFSQGARKLSLRGCRV